jgi:dTDP-3-amino-3,4,6-trideoxy-alpha-D-glucose transaminase
VTVPFLDLGAAYEELATELDGAYRSVMDSGRFLLGEQLAAFEEEFAAFSGAAHCAGVGSGFDALALGLRALGVEPGDDVLVPANGTAYTWVAVASIGAVPVGVEPSEASHTIDPARLDDAVSARTRAVVPVHLYGRPADMAPILDWAREQGLRVLADAAQAHGARVDDAGIGALGDAVAWSFYPSKNLGAFSDGGCMTSDDSDIAARLRRLRSYGSAGREELVEVGANSRLDELQAAFLRVFLSRLDDWNAARREAASRYAELGLGELCELPAEEPGHVYHAYVVRSAERDRIAEALAAEGIASAKHYVSPLHRQPAFSALGCADAALPETERAAAENLGLPIWAGIDTSTQERVVQVVRDAVAVPVRG